MPLSRPANRPLCRNGFTGGHQHGDQSGLQRRGHSRRRHRQGGGAGGHPRPRGGGQEIRLRDPAGMARLRLLRLLPQARPDDAGGLEGAHRRAGRDLLRRRRLAREGAGPHLAVGLADPVPARVRPVREPAAGAADARGALAARRPQARRHRLLGRPREHRRRVLLRRRAHVPGHRARDRRPGDVHDPDRRRPGPEVRLRARAEARQEAPHLVHEVERHLDHDAVLGRAREGDGEALPRRRAGTSTTSTS